MYESSVELNLPDTFFAALDKVVDAVQDGFNENSANKRTELYHNNLLNYTETQTFVPKFEEWQRNDYIKIGRSLMEGMSDIFFERLEKYNDDKDYYKEKESILPKQLVPTVNINVEKEKTETDDKADIGKLFSSIPLIILLAGIAAGTTAYGQLIESFMLLPKLISSSAGFTNTIKRSFDSAGSTIGKVGTLGKTIQNAFNTLATKVGKITAIGNSVSKMITKVGGTIGNIGTTIGKVGTLGKTIQNAFNTLVTKAGKIASIGNSTSKIITKVGGTIGNIGTILAGKVGQIAAKIASKLKFLPLIGSALGFYQTYLRLSRGEIFLGILEFAAAVSALLPGPGTAIAIGINAIQAIIESGSTGVGGIAGLTIKKIAGVGANLLPKLAGSISTLVAKPLALILKKIPFIGPIISFGMAVSDFINGSTLSGVLNVLAGLAGLVDFVAPGVGTAIAIAIDALNFFLTSTDTGKEVVSSIGNFFSGIGSSIGNFFTGIFGWIADAGKAVAEKIGIIWDSICGFASNIVSSIVNSIENKFKAITNVISTVISFGKDIFSKVSNMLPSFDIVAVTNIVSSIVNSIQSFFGNIASTIWEKITNFFVNIKNNLLTWLLSAFIPVSASFKLLDNLSISSLRERLATISGFFNDLGSDIANFFSSTINDIKEWITGVIGKIGNFFTNCYDIVAKSLSGLLDSLTAIFDFSGVDNIIDSVLTGIKEAFIKIWNEVKNFFKNAWSGIKEKATALIDGFIEKTKSFGKNIIGFFTDDDEESEEITAKLPKQQDARIANKTEEPAKIDSTLVDNQLTNDRHIRNIATDLARSDNAASIGLSKLCGITEVILSELIKKPGGLSTITTNNIISNGSSISQTTSTKAIDPRTLYSL